MASDGSEQKLRAFENKVVSRECGLVFNVVVAAAGAAAAAAAAARRRRHNKEIR
jgi:hypothetical protein